MFHFWAFMFGNMTNLEADNKLGFFGFLGDIKFEVL